LKQQVLKKGYLKAIPFLALAAAIAGMFVARAIVSISMIVMVIYALIFTDPRKTFTSFFKDPILVALSLIFFGYLFSSLYSTEDHGYLMERLRLKLPFLALPVAFASLNKKISQPVFYSLLYFFLIIVSATTIIVIIKYAADFKEINIAYVQGRVMDTPFNHIRYSLMVSFAIFIAYYLFGLKFFLRYPWERWLIAGLGFYLMCFLHLLAVRSGLVAFYLCVVYLIFNHIFRRRQLKTALCLSTIVLVLPILAYVMLPSVKAKITYMKYDLDQLLLFRNASGFSDGGRIISIKEGMAIFKENFIFGTGVGDLKHEMSEKLKEAPEDPPDNLLPHNQFVFVAAGTGIAGLLIFCLGIFLPLFNRKNLGNILFICFYIIVLSSFFTEATVEEQMGTAFYLLFLLLMHGYIQSENS
jgi:O-antigen ligase